MADDVSKHGMWSSRLLFVLAAAGSAVGLGNIWKFPYITGENGGGAFVLVYLLCIAFIGVPVMMAEVLIGRAGRESPINSIAKLTRQSGAPKDWGVIGWLGVAAGFLILSFYAVIAGWVVHYVFLLAAGTFDGADGAMTKEIFTDFTSPSGPIPWQELGWYTAFMAATVFIVARGVTRGLELAVRWLMPVLFVLLFVLVVYAAAVGDFAAAWSFLFKFDAGKLTAEGVLEAMGHAFFTLSLGMGAIMAYGAYVPARVSVAPTAVTIAVLDTVVALAAGLAIFPIVFANPHLEIGAGPSLIFQSLPVAFGGLPLGAAVGAAFFLLVAFAALTSAISLLEPAFAFLVERYNAKRAHVAVGAGALCWVLGIGSVVSDSFLGFVDKLTGQYMLPLGGLLIAIFAGWVLTARVVKDQLGFSDGWKWTVWTIAIRYVAPIGVVVVFGYPLFASIHEHLHAGM